MKKIFSLLLIVLLLTACAKKYEVITTNDALSLIDEGAIVLDVRTIQEYESGHIVGAVNIPLDDLDSISYAKDTTLIVYCATGVRSHDAVLKLVDMGYTSLYELDGGLLNWGGLTEE